MSVLERRIDARLKDVTRRFDSSKTEHVGFYVDWSGKYTKRYRKDLGYWTNMVNAEVIGNIFDNPELLESEG